MLKNVFVEKALEFLKPFHRPQLPNNATLYISPGTVFYTIVSFHSAVNLLFVWCVVSCMGECVSRMSESCAFRPIETQERDISAVIFLCSKNVQWCSDCLEHSYLCLVL